VLRNWQERLRIPLLLAPAMVIILFLFMGGLFMGFLQSLGFSPWLEDYRISLDAYVKIFTDRGFIRSLLLTCWIGFASTFLAMIFALICALALRRSFPGKRQVMFIFQLNVPIPHIVGAIGVLFLFSQSGLLSRMAYAVGLITTSSEFPAMVYDKYAIGIILEYLWKAIPFTAIIVLAVLQSVGEDYEDVARTLGANQWQRLWNVIIPLVMPGLLRASILVFAFTFGAFEIPFLLGQRYPSALPVLAYRSYHDVDLNARPEAMAMSMIIAALITVLILVYMKVTETYVRTE
jgi:putative spermidine/putrescine transport system permease protein